MRGQIYNEVFFPYYFCLNGHLCLDTAQAVTLFQTTMAKSGKREGELKKNHIMDYVCIG